MTRLSTMMAALVLVLAPVAAWADDEAAKAAALDRLIAASGSGTVLTQMNEAMLPLIMQPFIAANPGADEAVQAIVSEELLGAVTQLQPLLLEAVRLAYAKRFSLPEISAMADFLETDLGRKMVREQGPIMMEMMQVGQALGARAAQAALPRILARIEDAGMKRPRGI